MKPGDLFTVFATRNGMVSLVSSEYDDNFKIVGAVPGGVIGLIIRSGAQKDFVFVNGKMGWMSKAAMIPVSE